MNNKLYIIISLKHSTKDEVIFWRSDNSGYTYVPWAAGLYTEEQVKSKPTYYNDGFNSIAIPLTDDALKSCGLKFKINISEVRRFHQNNK